MKNKSQQQEWGKTGTHHEEEKWNPEIDSHINKCGRQSEPQKYKSNQQKNVLGEEVKMKKETLKENWKEVEIWFWQKTMQMECTKIFISDDCTQLIILEKVKFSNRRRLKRQNVLISIPENSLWKHKKEIDGIGRGDTEKENNSGREEKEEWRRLLSGSKSVASSLPGRRQVLIQIK